jgi:hypothetical protein
MFPTAGRIWDRAHYPPSQPASAMRYQMSDFCSPSPANDLVCNLQEHGLMDAFCKCAVIRTTRSDRNISCQVLTGSCGATSLIPPLLPLQRPSPKSNQGQDFSCTM